MKIAIACRIYNEIDIIKDFIEYYKDIATGGFYFYDDGSNDGTYEFLKQNENVKHLEKGERKSMSTSYGKQNQHRHNMVMRAFNDLNDDDFVLLLDADEFVYFNTDIKKLNGFDEIKLNLFDLYITEKDRQLCWKDRKMFGPECRHLTFMVKKRYFKRIKHHRTIEVLNNPKYITAGFVKHIGKGLSVERWERKCDFYSQKTIPKSYIQKWLSRKGGAIHTDKSDFGRKLYEWDYLIKNPDIWVSIR